VSEIINSYIVCRNLQCPPVCFTVSSHIPWVSFLAMVQLHPQINFWNFFGGVDQPATKNNCTKYEPDWSPWRAKWVTAIGAIGFARTQKRRQKCPTLTPHQIVSGNNLFNCRFETFSGPPLSGMYQSGWVYHLLSHLSDVPKVWKNTIFNSFWTGLILGNDHSHRI